MLTIDVFMAHSPALSNLLRQRLPKSSRYWPQIILALVRLRLLYGENPNPASAWFEAEGYGPERKFRRVRIWLRKQGLLTWEHSYREARESLRGKGYSREYSSNVYDVTGLVELLTEFLKTIFGSYEYATVKAREWKVPAAALRAPAKPPPKRREGAGWRDKALGAWW